MTNSIVREIDETVAKLARAERSSDTEAIQKAYEELFALCYYNNLDLIALAGEEENCWQFKVAQRVGPSNRQSSDFCVVGRTRGQFCS